MTITALAASNQSPGTTSIPIDKIVGAAAGGTVGYMIGHKLSHGVIYNALTQGAAGRIGGAVGGVAGEHMPKTLTAGLGVAIGEHLAPGEGIKRTLVDGLGAQLGAKAPELPTKLANAVRTLGELNPEKFGAPAEVIAKAAEGAPKAVGQVVGAGVGVNGARWFNGKLPLLIGIGGAVLGASIGVALIHKELTIGGN